MWHIGIDLHRRMLVMAAVKEDGEVIDPVRIDCQDTAAILNAVQDLKPFRAVIEATGTYRWLYDLLSRRGTVLLAHPLRLRAMIQRRTKTDKLDAQLLANLLRVDQIPLAYVPPKNYQELGKPLLLRVDHAPGFALASLGAGASGDARGSQRRRVAELLHADPQTLQREDRPGGDGPKTGGDLLEATATLARTTQEASGLTRART